MWCVALGLLLAPGQTLPAAAQGSDTDAGWRSIFKRDAAGPPSPPDNPLTPQKVALGARLFADPRLSGDGRRACAGCHEPRRGFTDGRRRANGLGGTPLQRNTPSLWNLAWGKHYFWDGRAATLESQAGMPIEDAREMAGDWPTILRVLAADPALAADFLTAFPGEATVSRDHVLRALASYVRSLVSPPTRFDAWIDGDGQALTAAEVRGFRLFTGKAGCVLCHVGWRFTDDRFHDIGLASRDPGRGALPGGTAGLAAFKTPGLRELKESAPYMHDGSLPTLTAVLDHYSGGVAGRPTVSTHVNRALRLTPAEKADLVAFLGTLSSEPAPPIRAEGTDGRR